MSTKHWALGLGLSCVMLVASVGHAALWIDAGGGSGTNTWSDAANWDSGVPGAGDDAIVNDTSSSFESRAVINGGTDALGDVATIGNGSSNIGRLTVFNGGSMTVNLLKLGEVGGRGFVTFKPGSSLTTLNNDIRLGGTQPNTYGNLHFEGPGTTASVAGGLIVGNANSGDLVIDGSTVDVTGGITVGNSANGTIVLSELGGAAGVLTTGGRVRLGDNGGSSGTVTQGPNTVFRATSTDDVFRIGEAGTGVWNMTGGLLEIARTAGMELAAFGGASSGTFNMSGGTLRVPDISSGGTALFDFSGGEIFLDGNRVGFRAEYDNYFQVTGPFAGSYQEVYDGGTDTTRLFVPEPASLALLCLGTMAMLSRRRK